MQKNTEDLNTSSYNYQTLENKFEMSQLWFIVKNYLASNPIYIFVAFTLFAIFLIFLLVAIVLGFKVSGIGMSIVIYNLIFIGISIVTGGLFLYSYTRKYTIAHKMRQFALANNISFISHQNPSSHIGLIFGVGDNRIIDYAYLFNDKHNTQMGSYSYSTGSGKNYEIHNFSYMVFDLPRNVPHMLLDSKSNNYMGLFSNLPASFSANQKLTLEGDFNNYFTLYAPKEYEKDALYIFTPDIMQVVIDQAKSYDIEIISNKLFIYSNAQLDLADKNEIERLLKIVNTLSQQFYDQTYYYSDQTIGNRAANIVNAKGSRLKKSYTSSILKATVFIAFIYIFFNYSGFSSTPFYFLLFGVAALAFKIYYKKF